MIFSLVTTVIHCFMRPSFDIYNISSHSDLKFYLNFVCLEAILK